MFKRWAAAIGGAILMSSVTLPAFAHGVPEHEHFIVTASGEQVRIGPPVCGQPITHDAFHRFHDMVHRGRAGEVFEDHNQQIGTITIVFCGGQP